jgi:hypothetical protein
MSAALSFSNHLWYLYYDEEHKIIFELKLHEDSNYYISDLCFEWIINNQ